MDIEELKDLIAPAVEVETPAAPAEPEPAAEPAPDAPARGADGKFTAKGDGEPEPLSKSELAGTLHALLTEREKRQAAERERDELRARAAPVEPPSFDEQLQTRLRSVTLTASRKFADQAYGKELTATVHDWALAKCDADPAFNASMMSNDDPYESAVQAYNREQIAAEVQSPDDLAQFKAWKAAQAAAPAADPPSPPQPADPPIPRSLANAPGNGAAGKPHVNVGEGEAFGALFKG